MRPIVFAGPLYGKTTVAANNPETFLDVESGYNKVDDNFNRLFDKWRSHEHDWKENRTRSKKDARSKSYKDLSKYAMSNANHVVLSHLGEELFDHAVATDRYVFAVYLTWDDVKERLNKWFSHLKTDKTNFDIIDIVKYRLMGTVTHANRLGLYNLPLIKEFEQAIGEMLHLILVSEEVSVHIRVWKHDDNGDPMYILYDYSVIEDPSTDPDSVKPGEQVMRVDVTTRLPMRLSFDIGNNVDIISNSGLTINGSSVSNVNEMVETHVSDIINI